MNTSRPQSIQIRWPLLLILVACLICLTCEHDPLPNQPQPVQLLKSAIKSPDPEDAPMGEPTGALIHASGCKETTGVSSKTDVPCNRDCIQWTYDSSGILYLTHVNTGFNCCPDSVHAVIAISDSTIQIQENERYGLCDCLCLFDLEYSFENITPAIWTIQIEGLYTVDDDPPLIRTISLADSSEGQFCVQRSYYPWCE